MMRPSVDVTEEPKNYIVEADLPGVKKENLDVTIGDGGHSVTIEGKTFRRRDGAGAAVVEGKTGEGMRSYFAAFNFDRKIT